MSIALKASQMGGMPVTRMYGGVKQGRRDLAYAGDPGLFGALWGAIKGGVSGLVTGGPLGALSGALKGGVAGAIGQPKTTGQAVKGVSLAIPSSTQVLRVGPGTNTNPGGGMAVGFTTPGGGIGFGPGAPTVGFQGGSVGGAGYYAPGTALQVQKRGHLNKTGYFLKDGTYIAPGSKVVANRRMNPLNPTSLSRSLRRMQSFAKATKHMRSEAGKVATAVHGGARRSSCGCKGKKR